MSGPAILVDTNVLVYSVDSREPMRRDRARDVLRALRGRAVPHVSTQILGECFATLVTRFRIGFDADGASSAVRAICAAMNVLSVDERVVREAMWGVRRYQMHYYDAQVWATARIAGIDTILTEDVQSAPEIEGVRYVNPFAGDFDATAFLGTLG